MKIEPCLQCTTAKTSPRIRELLSSHTITRAIRITTTATATTTAPPAIMRTTACTADITLSVITAVITTRPTVSIDFMTLNIEYLY